METKDTPAPAPEIKDDMVPKAELDNVRGEVTKFRAMVSELEEKLKAKEIDSLKGAKNWEEIAKLKEDEANKAAGELTEWKKSVMFDKKISAVREEAIKQKIRPESLEDLDGFDFGDMVQVEATIGQQGKRINVIGADRAVQYLRQKRPHWFQETKAPNVNTTTQGVVQSTEGSVDAKQVSAAYAKAQKSGDYTEYNSLHSQFVKQKQARH